LPNYTGANDVLKPKFKFSTLLSKIDKGEIKALFYLGFI